MSRARASPALGTPNYGPKIDVSALETVAYDGSTGFSGRPGVRAVDRGSRGNGGGLVEDLAIHA